MIKMIKFIALLILVFVIGIIIGRKTMKYDGVFVVDDSDSDTTKWILNVDINPNEIPNRKSLRFAVENTDNPTRC